MAGVMEKYAWRLTFAYEGDTFTLKSTRKLVKRVPPGQPVNLNHTGRFVEVRGPERQIMYRRGISELLPDTIEYRTGDPAQPLGRAPAPRRGEVSILVPDLPDSHSVALVVAGGAGFAARSATPPGAKSGTESDVESSDETSAPRDLIAVDLPREGGEQ